MNVALNEEFQNFWAKFNDIHRRTKEYFILAEEYNENLETFIQPIKEHKDALEHIVRATSKCLNSNENCSEDDFEYIKANLDKALGHIYRAFYDCSDILSIVLRKKISEGLKPFTYEEIVEAWTGYSQIRERLIKIPSQFQELRIKKDIGKITNKFLDKYKAEIDWLFEVYETLYIKIIPRLYSNKKKKR